MGSIVNFFMFRSEHWHLTLFTIRKNRLIIWFYTRTNTSILTTASVCLHLWICRKVTFSVSICSTSVTSIRFTIRSLVITRFYSNWWNIRVQLIICPNISTNFLNPFSCQNLTHFIDYHILFIKIYTCDCLVSSMVSFAFICSYQ